MKKYLLITITFLINSSTFAQYTPTSPYFLNPELAIGYTDSCANFWLQTWDNSIGGFFTNIDKFGNVIQRLLERCGINTILTSKLNPQLLPDIDVLVIADYSRDDEIIGQNGDMTASELARIAPNITVIQFAGRIAVRAIRELGLTVFPGIELQSHRMAKTLAHLGPRPVIELHTAGLKVGEFAIRDRNESSTSITSNKLIQKVY